MSTIYYLNQAVLPTIPKPHDCIITSIEYDSEFLTLKFEDDISYHDSTKIYNPNAKSLIIKIHLLDSQFDVYKWERHLFSGKEKGLSLINCNKVFSKINRLEYLSHYIAYNSMIIELFQSDYIILKIETDFIELEWIEK